MNTIRTSSRSSVVCSSCFRKLLPEGRLTWRALSTSTQHLSEADLQSSGSQRRLEEAPAPSSSVEAGQQLGTREAGSIGGSKRRRAAVASTSQIPFEQLPYQCFQEALKVLRDDRTEKVVEIKEYRERILRELEKMKLAEQKAGDDASRAVISQLRKSRLRHMQKHLNWLKIQADINDQSVKRRFEDGLGDMSKPIYRHLQETKWRSYERKIVQQRLDQMHVIPDVLPYFNPIVQLNVVWPNKKLQHGELIGSDTSESPPAIQAQVFDSGERLVTIAIVDSDVPHVESNNFIHRCHGLYTNVLISPTSGNVSLRQLEKSRSDSVVVPWLPPHCQKGAPWHRLSVWMLNQRDNKPLDPEALQTRLKEKTFSLRGTVSQWGLEVVGATMFRTSWDEWTAAVMKRNGIEGLDIEYQPKPITPMPYKKKDGARYR